MTTRGPTGTASPPPVWLPTTPLPLTEIPPSHALHRIHRSDRSPIFFSPGPNQPPTGRFDGATGAFGVLYASMTVEGAFAETILRNPTRRLVARSEIEQRSSSTLLPSRTLRLVRMSGSGLQELGLDNAITTGPYGPCGLWADALFAHPNRPDGIAYTSRYDPEQVSVALFNRPGLDVQPRDTVSLTDLMPQVASILRRYGKGLDQ